jgi:hypothetical protein
MIELEESIQKSGDRHLNPGLAGNPGKPNVFGHIIKNNENQQ